MREEGENATRDGGGNGDWRWLRRATAECKDVRHGMGRLRAALPPRGTLSGGGGCSELNVLAIVNALFIFLPPPAFDAPRRQSCLTKT